jgi:hypothetical protein
MTSQKRTILLYLRDVRMGDWENGWVPAYKLRGKQTDYGFLGHQADRRLRELYNEGKVERRINRGYVEYRWTPVEEKEWTSEEILMWATR